MGSSKIYIKVQSLKNHPIRKLFMMVFIIEDRGEFWRVLYTPLFGKNYYEDVQKGYELPYLQKLKRINRNSVLFCYMGNDILQVLEETFVYNNHSYVYRQLPENSNIYIE